MTKPSQPATIIGGPASPFVRKVLAVCEMKGVPAPFPMAAGDNWFSRFLLGANSLLIRLTRGLFAYQIFVRAKALPGVPYLLDAALEESQKKVKALAAVA